MIQQQGPPRCAQGPLERGLRQKAVVLRIDPPRCVHWQPHRGGGLRPHGGFLVRAAQPLRHIGGEGQMRPRGGVCIEIIVDKGGVFVRPGHAVDAEGPAPLGYKAANVDPDPRRFEQHLGGLGQEGLIIGGIDVKLQRISDVGVDVILRRARGVMR